jgi:hypothetical protein
VATARYRVTLRGRLGDRFADAFPGATMEDGGRDTRLVTEPIDDAELDRLLTRVGDFGLVWISIETMP